MRLEGWNHIPAGYTATFDVAAAPWWLRAWLRTPFVDRFAYPVMVRRGHGLLRRLPNSTVGLQEPVTGGWRLDPSPGPSASYR